MNQCEHAAVHAINQEWKPQLLLAVEAAQANVIGLAHGLVSHDFRVLHSSSAHVFGQSPRLRGVSFRVPLASYAPLLGGAPWRSGTSVAFRVLLALARPKRRAIKARGSRGGEGGTAAARLDGAEPGGLLGFPKIGMP